MARTLTALACAVAWLLLGRAADAQSAAPTTPRLVFDVTRSGADEAPVRPPARDVPAAWRVTVDAADIQANARALRQSAPAGWRIWLTIRNADAERIDAAAWAGHMRQALTSLPALSAVELQMHGTDPRRAAFLIKVTAAEVRAASADVAVVLGGDAVRADARDAVVTPDVAPSVDALALPAGENASAALDWITDRDPGATLALLDQELSTEAPRRDFADRQITGLGGPTATQGYRLDAARLPAVLRAVDRLQDTLTGDVALVSMAAGGVRLSNGARDLTQEIPWRVLYNLTTLGTYLVIDVPAPLASEVLTVDAIVPAAGAVAVRDPVQERDTPALSVSRDEEKQRTTATLRLPRAGVWLIDFNRGVDPAFIQQEDVTASRTLRVEEILARHQAQQAAQRLAAPRYIVNGTMQQYFRPTLTDPGFDVLTENRFFVDEHDGMEWEERSFSVNGAKFGEPRPPFPLLQPEKVLARPLVIELDARYRYRLTGTGTINGRPSYEIAFEPADASRSLFRGTVWIDRENYARLRQQAVQTNLTAPVVSNDETQDFALVRTPSGRDAWLPSRIYNQQLVLIAGRNLLVERRITFDGYEVAPADFEAQRQDARRGSRTMYRDTDAGVRYLVKEGDTRVVSEMATTKAKAMAMGVTLDPSYDFPLPIIGINYLNFKFLGRSDTQLAVLFGGVLAAGNIQRPKLIANRIDASVDFFGIAPPASDRFYLPSGERQEERLLTWPLSSGLNLGYQFTSYQKLSAQYQFRFDGYVRDRTTGADYTTPSSTVTNGVGLLYEFRRAGYSVTANGVWSRRASWRSWGPAGALQRTPADYGKYSLSGSKTFYFGPFSKFVLNAAWYTGTRLDRFSQYQFGLFDETRIHGVPSSGVRYGELAMARGQYSFNIFEQYRLDLFLDRAWGRSRPFAGTALAAAHSWEPLTGIGAAVNVRVPGRNMILRADIGKSFLPDRYRSLGSTVVQILLLRPL